MKKILFILSIIFVGCETQNNKDNATWSFDASTGDYIEWQSENDFANEMTNAAFSHLYNVEYEKANVFLKKHWNMTHLFLDHMWYWQVWLQLGLKKKPCM